jgi:DNA-directed RNA polymerase
MLNAEALIQNTADRTGLQAELDKLARIDGRERFLERTAKARQSGNGVDTKAGQVTLPLLIPHVALNLQAALEEAAPKGRAGKTARWYSVYKTIGNMDLLAAEGVRSLLNGVGSQHRCQKVLISLGKAVENAYLIQTLLDQDEKSWTKRIKKVQASNDTASGRAKGLRGTAKALKAEVEEPWGDDECLQMSVPLANAVLATHLFERCAETEDADTVDWFGLTPEGLSLIQELDETHMWTQPSLWPMAVPPAPWADVNKGGYHDQDIAKRVPMIRTHNKDHKAMVSQALKAGKMDQVVKALDAIGSTPFKLNAPVVDLVRWVAEREKQGASLGIKKFPRLSRVAIPERPENFDGLSHGERSKIIQAEKKARRVNKGIGPNAVNLSNDMSMMQHLLKLGTFYLPHNMDFRGRVYPVPVFNHQRADYIKGTFTFSNGKPLGTHGLRWLSRALANAGAFDKIDKQSWAAREKWVADNMELIIATATNPKEDLRWTKADAPFTFYAFCLEMLAALKHPQGPEAFVSYLPIALDGSNSGVQHYSCALKAPEGKYVNLVPQDLPADFYQVIWGDVAQVCQDTITKIAPLTGDARDLIAPLAQQVREWRKENPKSKEVCPVQETLERACAEVVLQVNGGRSLVKRPAMTYGYGSVAYGFKEQLMEDHMDPLEIDRISGKIAVHPYGDDAGEAVASWLSKRIYKAVVDRLSLVNRGMGFFQSCAAALAHEGKPMIWHTPLGLPVVQAYQQYETKRVELFLYSQKVEVPTLKDVVQADGSVLQRYRASARIKPTGEILKDKQKSAIAPNVIHSMDSSHLMKAVLYSLEHNITDFMLIHDSFATHAGACGNPDVMENSGFFWIVKQSFVDLYEEYDLFTEVHNATLLALSPEGRERLEAMPDGKLPQKGTLDRLSILTSHYCFS